MESVSLVTGQLGYVMGWIEEPDAKNSWGDKNSCNSVAAFPHAVGEISSLFTFPMIIKEPSNLVA